MQDNMCMNKVVFMQFEDTLYANGLNLSYMMCIMCKVSNNYEVF